MSSAITRDEVVATIDRGEITVLEALPASYYEDARLPGALNLPHDQVGELAAGLLVDKQDWIDAGLPTETGPSASVGGDR